MYAVVEQEAGVSLIVPRLINAGSGMPPNRLVDYGIGLTTKAQTFGTVDPKADRRFTRCKAIRSPFVSDETMEKRRRQHTRSPPVMMRGRLYQQQYGSG